jgi:hypothetical protein
VVPIVNRETTLPVVSTACPRCGKHRLGSFRFCRNCRYDFDREAWTTRPEAFGPVEDFEPFDLFPPPDSSVQGARPTGLRVAAAIAVAILAGVLAIGVAARSLGLL